jgi:hypothetical protein
MRHVDHQRAVRTTVARLPRALAVAALLALVIQACSGDDDEQPVAGAPARTTTSSDDSDTTTTQASTTTTTATATTEPAEEFDSVEDEIIARYRGYWDARFAANSPPNPDDPALREYATGDQLGHVIDEAEAHRADGVELRRPDSPVDFQTVSVVSVDGDAAVVQECVVNDTVIVRSDSGAVVDDAVATYNVRGDMQRVDGEWRLAAANQLQRWEGVAGCALAD